MRRWIGRWGVRWAALLALLGPGCCSAPLIAPPPPGEVPSELHKVTLPPYVIEPPDILLIEVYLPPPPGGSDAILLSPQPIAGQHIVRPDGTVSLGVYGSLPLAGLTLDQAREQVRQFIAQSPVQTAGPKDPSKYLVIVDVFAYNSKSYYVITDGAGYGEQVFPFPVTGSETVLDAIGRIYGLPAVASKRNIWVARRSPLPGDHDQILPVDWVGITQHGNTNTNYQVLPGDRVYVSSQKIIRNTNTLNKFLAPVEKILGVTLLGSETVNSINGRNGGTGG